MGLRRGSTLGTSLADSSPDNPTAGLGMTPCVLGRPGRPPASIRSMHDDVALARLGNHFQLDDLAVSHLAGDHRPLRRVEPEIDVPLLRPGGVHVGVRSQIRKLTL